MTILDELSSGANGSLIGKAENALSVSSLTSAGESVIAGSPVFDQNRARAAIVVDTAYRVYDTYKRWQWVLFVLSLAGAAGSGYLLWKRWEHREARWWWLSTGIASAAGAWFTWPTPDAPPATVSTGAAPTETPAFINWLDGMVAARTQSSPGWEGIAWKRLSLDLGFAPMPGALSTLLLKNSQ
jgi:hypothetical protein